MVEVGGAAGIAERAAGNDSCFSSFARGLAPLYC